MFPALHACQERRAAGSSLPSRTRQLLSLHICIQSTDGLVCGAQRTSGAGGFGPTGSPQLPTPCAPWPSMSLPQPTGRQCTSTTPTSRSAAQFWPPLGFRQGTGGSGWGWLCCWAMRWSSISLPLWLSHFFHVRLSSPVIRCCTMSFASRLSTLE